MRIVKPAGLLCLITLLLTAMIFTSCGGGNQNGAGTDNTAKQNDGNITETTGVEIKPELPNEKYNGYVMRFLVMGDAYNHYQSREIGAAAENGELINDAVYLRNMLVESDLDVLIKAIPSNRIISDAKSSILAGGDDYDVVMPIVDEGVKAVQSGLFYDLNQIPYLNLENPWWDQRMTTGLAINGYIYFATGDISILDNECTMCIFFNKNMIKNLMLENPYDIVQAGKWTLDKEYEMSLNVTKDENGDGKYTCPEDIFGMQISSNTPHSMFYAAGERIVTLNQDGDYEFTMYNERSVNVVEKIMKVCSEPLNLTPKTKGGGDYNIYIPAFGAGKILFTHLALIDINFFRNDNTDFGVLPYPKFDENQEKYNNFVSTICVPGAAVPGNAENIARTGAVLEDMAYHSVSTLTYAYYDQTLNVRLIRDTESSDMLDIIFKTRVYDMGYMFDWGGLGGMIGNMYASGKTDFTSEYDSRREKAIADMEKSFEAFKSLT